MFPMDDADELSKLVRIQSLEGCADRTSGIGIGEAHPLRSHTVDAGRLDEPLTIAAQIAVAHVVTHYIYNIMV